MKRLLVVTLCIVVVASLTATFFACNGDKTVNKGSISYTGIYYEYSNGV